MQDATHQPWTGRWNHTLRTTYITYYFTRLVERGLVVGALDLSAEGPGFKSSSLPLDGFVFGGPEFKSYTLCK